ncbi:MAG: transposase, partial [Acidimicrobiales bacterium]
PPHGTQSRLSYRSSRLKLIWTDQGFKKALAKACRAVKITASVLKRTKKKGFEPIPRRWVVERTFSWIINQRRLKIDYERHPLTTEGFVWAAQTKLALRRPT